MSMSPIHVFLAIFAFALTVVGQETRQAAEPPAQEIIQTKHAQAAADKAAAEQAVAEKAAAKAAQAVSVAAKAAPKQPSAAEKPAAKSDELEKLEQSMALEKSEHEKQDLEHVNKVKAQVDKIEKLLDSRDEWTKDTDGEGKMNGLGEIESLRLRATYFSIERGFRKEVEREIRDLIKLMRQWASFRAAFKERLTVMKLELRLAALEQKEVVATPAVTRKEDFEYYEVKTESSLTQISALPEVYGDPTLWRHLYTANKEKIADPEKPIPAGTVLVVPDLSGK